MSDLPPPPPGGTPPPPPPPDGMAAPALMGEKAGFGTRLGAYLIDAIVVGVPLWIIIFITASVVPSEVVLCRNETAFCEQPTGAGFGILALVALAAVAFVILYWGTLEGKQGQSIGKKAVGIKTIDSTTGEPIGFGRAVGRLFARLISGMVCSLGYLWMLWDDDKQTWHDKMVNSYVVKA